MEIIRIGLNLPERKLIFININVCEPRSAFWYTDAGDFEFERLRAKDRLDVISTNLGKAHGNEGTIQNAQNCRIAWAYLTKSLGFFKLILKVVKQSFHTVDLI